MSRMAKRRTKNDAAQAVKGADSETSSPSEGVVIYLQLPPNKAKLKQVIEQLALDHNRKLTGECIQALEEWAKLHKVWPPVSTSPPDESA
jgi:hypothetical protein